ncbi:hypothetical protein JTE90_026069 [Oedothorax gibbosus]|uniref:Large ribosomal subunit protein uL23m n=1 Tax=Oedothorax gibbosus TaxID=931172 RepID=A0AAV6TYS3_9ARAC|nr:hypothetical protein JTE90_026069 [Oedothorax gibbosus]
MSFRVYPKFVKGNPKLRIFLPNFYMKLIKPKVEVPNNHVQFIIPLEMTQYDVVNYLEKIYKVPVAQINTKMYTGDLKKTFKNYLIKEPDYKIAYVVLPEGMEFKFPDIFPELKKEKANKERERYIEQTQDLQKQRKRNWHQVDIPTWFGA